MNPELRRNLWLELSVHRLLATPAIIALACALILANSDDYQPLTAVAALAAALLLGAFGSKLAADSIGEEARNRTWDAQRLTSIGPWQMTVGKLAGATAFAWYAGGLCLAVFVAAGSQWTSTLKLAGLIVAASVLCHAIAFIGTVMSAHTQRHARSSGWAWALAVLWWVASSMRAWLDGHQTLIRWWGTDYGSIDFALASAVTFAAWAVFGGWRCVCRALHVPTAPWALVLFLCFVSVYLAGFPWPWGATGARLVASIGVGVSLAAAYALLFLEQTGAVAVRRVQMRAARRQWAQLARELPGWPVALALGLLFALASQLTAGRGVTTWQLADVAVVLWLFAVRDAALMQAFAFSRQPRRVVPTTLIYLAVLYGLLPWLSDALGADWLTRLLLPFGQRADGQVTLAAAAQMALAVGIAALRWRRL